jgi:hypothetical protein
MPGKKPHKPRNGRKPRQGRNPAWQIILEEMKSQNHVVIEKMEDVEARLREDVQRGDGELKVEMRDLRTAVQHNSTDIRALQADVQGLTAKVDALTGVEQRVSVLERKGA